MTMESLVERQAPIDFEVANALIVATPESWSIAEMVVHRDEDASYERMSISISSPEGHRDLIGPTEEIQAGLYKLSGLYREFGKAWVSVTYRVELLPDGNWKYNARFTD